MKPRINLIVARSKNGVIGKDGKLPWRLPEDLKFFKEKTLNHSVIMGRKTWESLGKPLPNRTNIVLSRDPFYTAPGALTAWKFEDALALADTDEVFVIGGAEVYREALPYADVAWVTEIDLETEGDATFDDLDRSEWKRVWYEEHDGFTFQRFQRARKRTMLYTLPEWCLSQLELSANVKILLFFILYTVNLRMRVSSGRLWERSNFARASLQRSLNELVEIGILTRHTREKRNEGYIYELNAGRLVELGAPNVSEFFKGYKHGLETGN